MKIFYLSLKVGLIFSLLISFLSLHSQNNYEKILLESFPEDGTAGTAIVVKNGEIIYKGASGMANLELGIEAKPEHIFRLGSITKQFTSVAILQLKEDGKLNLEDNFTKYLPDYPLGDRKVTVAQLLNHTSGIASYTDIPGFMQNRTRNFMAVDSLINYFQKFPFDFEPGEAWNYNNSAYILLGAIIEKISGMSYAEYLEKEIFDKIGLENTYYDDSRKIIKNRIPGYSPSNN